MKVGGAKKSETGGDKQAKKEKSSGFFHRFVSKKGSENVRAENRPDVEMFISCADKKVIKLTRITNPAEAQQRWLMQRLPGTGQSETEQNGNAQSTSPSDTELRQLPSICAEFATESECEWQDCPHLHVCAGWMTDVCPRPRRCCVPHTLHTAHNVKVLRQAGWREDEQEELRFWLRYEDNRQRLEDAHLPPVCINHARGVCRDNACGSLHICAKFMLGQCLKNGCHFGHDLVGDEQNNAVLEVSGCENMSEKKILRQMRVCMQGHDVMNMM